MPLKNINTMNKFLYQGFTVCSAYMYCHVDIFVSGVWPISVRAYSMGCEYNFDKLSV